jgi:hypothetical protein
MMELPSGYRAERISKENFNDFIIIHREAFKSNIKPDFTKNKFNTLQVSGIENIGYIIYHSDGEPVSYYGVYPMFAFLGKKRVLIAQSGDTMTIPTHTGLGLFISSAQLTHNLCKEYNIKGVFGFPSPSSYRTFKKKLNWKFNENLNKYIFKVPTIPIGYLTQKIKFLRNPYIWWIRIILKFYNKSDFFEGSVTANGQDGIHRDKHFWNYKMSCKDIFAVKIRGADVVLKANGTLSIGDVNITKETEFRPILNRLKLLSFLTFNAHLIFCMSPGTLLDEKLSMIKKGIIILPIGFLNLNEEYDLSTLRFTFFDLDTF